MSDQPNKEERLNDVELDSDYNESPNVMKQKTEPNPLPSTSNAMESKEEEIMDQNTSLTWWDSAYKLGENVLYVADFLGEVFAEFFGMTQSRYQWAIDAYERQQRWENEDKRKEELHRKRLMNQYKKNKKNKKKSESMNEENIDINPNDIALSIHNRGVIDEEEITKNSEVTNNHLEIDDGKEEEQPQNIERNDENNPVQVS